MKTSKLVQVHMNHLKGFTCAEGLLPALASVSSRSRPWHKVRIWSLDANEGLHRLTIEIHSTSQITFKHTSLF